MKNKRKNEKSLRVLFGTTFTRKAALQELDMKTTLLLQQDLIKQPIPEILRRTRKPLPTALQWHIVATVSHAPLSPVTTLWLTLKPNAVPDIVLRGYARDVAIYVTERVFPTSSVAWRIIKCLDFNAGTVQLSALAALGDAREAARGTQASAGNENIRLAANALERAASEDPLEAAIGVSEVAVEAYRALQAPDEGFVVAALATKMSRLCTKALEQHPQKDILKARL